MKRVFIILGIIAAVLLVVFLVLRNVTKSSSPEAVAEINQNGLVVKVDYCRPSMKSRKIFGSLVPYGQVWRTGANEATLIDFNQNVTVSGQPLKAGQYSLWTIPSQQGWIAVFNGQTGQWGTQYDQAKDVLRVPMQTRQVDSAIEQFKIDFAPQPTGANMVLGWEQTEAMLPIQKQ